MGDTENIVRAQKIHPPIPHLAGSRFPARKRYVRKDRKAKTKRPLCNRTSPARSMENKIGIVAERDEKNKKDGVTSKGIEPEHSAMPTACEVE